MDLLVLPYGRHGFVVRCERRRAKVEVRDEAWTK